MQKKSFSILDLFVVILLVVLYIFSTTNLNKISPDNKQVLYHVDHAFPQYKVIKTFDTGIHL
ncbi:DsbC family protein, partial [Francisella tularensis subsp. holarctica]|nr:DsbC family protein [Francisella tularensis subsp. holarctica]